MLKLSFKSNRFNLLKDELLAIGEVLKGTDIVVLSDEMYENYL